MDPRKGKPGQSRETRNICTCNKITQARIEDAIKRGCRTLPAIFGATTAGVGQCGGSCRPTLQLMLDGYLRSGTFPENPLRERAETKDNALAPAPQIPHDTKPKNSDTNKQEPTQVNTPQTFWKKCSSCKNPIAFGAKYFVCSVSTCNGKRTGYVFCSVPCFERHLPGARHKDAAAFEEVAPLR